MDRGRREEEEEEEEDVWLVGAEGREGVGDAGASSHLAPRSPARLGP